jgi:hypothetical protein
MRRNKKQMAFIVSFFIIFCLIAGNAFAASLQWDASSGTVDGYTVHYGTSSSNPSNSINVGNTTQYNIDALPLTENTQYYFCVSAYNTSGESAPCSPVAYTPADTTPPAPPVGLVAE